MDQETRLRPDDLIALAAPALIACRRPIAELLESDGIAYRPPDDFRLPSAFTDDDAPFYMSLLTSYVRDLGPAFKLTEGRLLFDPKDAALLIKDFSTLTNALLNAKLLEEALACIDGERFLVAMILSSTKSIPIDDPVLYRTVFTQMMIRRSEISA